jgi:RNA polymerase sigma-70 factor (ECF subfamily)
MDHDDALALPDTGQASPDDEFDRRWAVTVLARGLDALRQECGAEGREGFFDHVKPLLTGSAAHGDQTGIATACGMSVAALRMAVHRLKKKLLECVRREVAGTLEDPEMVREEMQTLFVALGG